MLKKESQNLEIDNLDIDILKQLMQDATKPYTEIAKDLIVSGGTIHVRMKKLHEMGIIKGSHLIIDPQKAGYDICAFLGIYLEKGIQYKDAVAQLSQIKEVVELHYTTGAYSMFAKIICRDTNHLRHVLNEEIQAVAGIQRTETLISLEESIRRQIELG
ncbi:Lrp/AsnC ligand binding domain-containing protein [Pedobacter antarcticus]|uniref:Transcriptional regulator n=2 Tax=Pedobacter antarcticus TaxID=34086 RepID=A0A081PM17_9SPHI|nr:Lrp/AsnC ligand binding domain-containing protein [Pedobacter antarcticus]KEQ31740.1 transcriptional regulator [Pedobacter antarcticus 4BY]SDM92312.1 Lrp/AsnC family transcriptional regulator, regulator for asnA, asnC and gidA [Pedobacter antarcticus]SFF47298.1 Lrp/AsnC family transcriptional regulator, regulator for asnA, asnC and gidA [Pedobacter antarcticus]